MKNTDVALICGSNAAENHPVSFAWLNEARENRGAKIIHVDPRYTRTSAQSDLYAPIRSGTDITFYGGMINYMLEKERIHKEYVVAYTNASLIIKDTYSFDPEKGLFSGFDPVTEKYSDRSSWDYERDQEGNIVTDKSLKNPNTVYQLMKQHYSRYTPDLVSKISGMPVDKFLEVCELFTSSHTPDKTGTILYAMGQTQHTVGSQNVRIMAMIQLLLGNMGRPGGGVNALRGHSNVQGSTDMAALYHLLPGYLPAPTDALATLADYNATTPQANSYWANRPKFITSLTKAWWGDAATKENDFAYGWLPKYQADKNLSHIPLFEDMYAGKIKGLFNWGQNPVVSGPHSNLETKALEKLDWMVCLDPFANETSTFWKRPGVDPKDIGTEVFLLPVTTFLEKEGSITTSGRLLQYRWQAVKGLGNTKQETWILDKLVKAVKSQYATSSRPEDEPIQKLTWNYGDPEDHRSYIDAVMQEINGKDLTTNTLVPGFGALKEDGTTICGNWIYSGMYTEEGNKTQNRSLEDPSELGVFPKWGFAWPANRRVLYNRAGADPAGKPWSEDKKTIWWDATQGKWVGFDVPDFVPTMAPDSELGSKPFIMLPDRLGRLFNIGGLNEGPLPEHYEPMESPVQNLMSKQQNNPVVVKWGASLNDFGDAKDYPIITSTWRVCEHWHTGAMSRNLPWLAELMPALFVEMSNTLAKAKGIKNGETVEVASIRGKIKAVAMVTNRIKALKVNDKMVEQIGLSWHFGYAGLVTGDITNCLTPHVGDANTTIPEYKAFLCDVRKVM